jgi:hypothetical protein
MPEPLEHLDAAARASGNNVSPMQVAKSATLMRPTVPLRARRLRLELGADVGHWLQSAT